MSPDFDEDTLSIHQILSEKSVFELIKKLSQKLIDTSKNKKATRTCRNVEEKQQYHLQVYELLLRHRSDNRDDLDQRLVLHVSQLRLHDSQVKQLMQLLEKLQRSSPDSAPGIVNLLLTVASCQERQTSSSTGLRTPKKVGIFECPQEMLDGSLFEQRPSNDNCERQDPLLQLNFNLLPGSNLRLAQRFFNLYGVPTEVTQQTGWGTSKDQQSARDQGYSSPPASEVDWEEAAALGPLPRYRTWEYLGHLVPQPESPLLSEADPPSGPESLQGLQRDLTFLLSGVTSASFPFLEEQQTFVLAENWNVVGLPRQVAERVLGPLLECGAKYRHLEECVARANKEDGLLVKALWQAVGRFLVLHREACQRALLRTARFSQLVCGLRWLTPPLSAVASLCQGSVDSLELLEQLCTSAAHLLPGRTACVFYSLLKSVVDAYLRILCSWLFEGEVEVAASREFFVQLQPSMLAMKSRKFWTQGFVLLDARVPTFLQGLVEQLLLCGKAVCLLKLCNPQEPLVNELREARPLVECCLQPKELLELQRSCDQYEQRVRQVCGEPVTAVTQMERSSEQQLAFFEMVRQLHQQRVREIRAKQLAEREAVCEQKRKQREELQQQISEVRARKAERQLQEKQEEEERQVILEAQNALYDQRVAMEREKILRHYQDLHDATDRKLERTQRKIQLLELELGELTGDPRDNNNLFSSQASDTDNNANVMVVESADGTPQDACPPTTKPRNVPTSLPVTSTFEDVRNANKVNDNVSAVITEDSAASQGMETSAATEIYTRGISEAARNRARVLDHELNLITNYDTQDSKQLSSAQTEAMKIKSKILREEYDVLPTIDNKNLGNKKYLQCNTEDSTRNEDAARIRARAQEHDWASYNQPEQVHLNNKDCSPSSESMESPSSSGSSADHDQKQQDANVRYSVMSVSMESAPLTEDLETPVLPSSAMCTSFETISSANLLSPMTSSVMTDSKLTPACDVPRPLPTSASNTSFLSALSVLSEPIKWNVSRNKEYVSSKVKQLDVSSSHLSHLLHQTVSAVLATQVRLVNQSVLRLFLQDEQLLTHFCSLRQYFLLVDGEFARHITESLCVGMEQNADKPHTFLNFISLDSILRHALSSSVHGCKDPNVSRLSLGIRFEPDKFEPSKPDALNCVQLQYQVAWPLCLIVSPDTLFQYDRIFNFLLGLRRGVWAMDDSFQLLQQSYNCGKLSRSSQYHQLRMFRHDMGHFMQAYHSFIMNFAVLQSWKNCEKILKTAKTLDELYKAHTYFVKQVLFSSLLRKEADSVQKLLQAVLKSVLKFRRILGAFDWCDGIHPSFERLEHTYIMFKERSRLLLRHLCKLASRGYQPELYELLHVLNMNDYYNLAL